ncbi:hypothetical protein GCM10010377_81370 [Streptomyces viridiviolaceus]|uniref:Secreted protein n=1 Tax=Streptomyces viridiviolaceus TaxID=68282 RepID=A0ABW2ECS2_9ACTN|nr:hypothetical protein [Streptomyces viridiviolaceus]GHB79024.1 hypothetical protein GCM10010377_81370 [Streptomyces viridiviolaceus]
METSAWQRLGHLAGACCAAVLLAATAGAASAVAAPEATKAAAESPRAAPHDNPCTGNHIEGGSLVWDPPGCTPP